MKKYSGVLVFSLLLLWSVTTLGQSKPDQSQKSESASSQSDSGVQPSTSNSVEILSDTQGADFSSFLLQWHRITQATWDKLITPEANRPALTEGTVTIRFKILPNGKIKDRSMSLEGRSGSTALDRAAWFALVNSHYPPLPQEFHGPYLELRAAFVHNMKQH